MKPILIIFKSYYPDIYDIFEYLDSYKECKILNFINNDSFINSSITLDKITLHCNMERSMINMIEDPCPCYRNLSFMLYKFKKDNCMHELTHTYKNIYSEELIELLSFIKRIYSFNKILEEFIISKK